MEQNYHNTEGLTRMIEQKRKEMLEIAWYEGVDSTKTLKVSQELDELILKEQTLLKRTEL